MSKPLKRHPGLQPLSREHHEGLLLCWKIRKGLSTGVDPERIKAYVDWFFENKLLPHFEIEECAVFPILGNEHPGVITALGQHEQLIDLFRQKSEVPGVLEEIPDTLENHIRFEERQLFNTIQEAASEEEWAKVDHVHASLSANCGIWRDEFWK